MLDSKELVVLLDAYNNHGRSQSFSTSKYGIDRLRSLGLLEPYDPRRLGERTTPLGTDICKELVIIVSNLLQGEL